MPVGNVGELVLRTDCPWAMAKGYYRMPEAAAKARRNDWLHTGDMFRVDDADSHYFVNRAKDAIRRRGENISPFEIEEQVLAHLAQLETAVVGGSRRRRRPGCARSRRTRTRDDDRPTELIGILIPRLGHFMVPCCVRPAEVIHCPDSI